MCANWISPETKIEEIAVGLHIAQPSTNSAGFVIEATTGPCYERTQITSVQDYEQIFGLPTTSNNKFWFTGYNFLQYANNLQTVRCIGKTSLNSGIALKQKDATSTTATSATCTRLNESDEPTISFLTDDKLKFFYKYPGTLGSNYKVAICNYEDFDTIKLTHGTVTDGPFVVGETVTDASTSATGVIVAVDASNTWIKVNKVFGTFGTNSISGGTSTASATVSLVGDYIEATTGVTFDSLYDYSMTSDNVLVVVLDSDNEVLEVFNTSLTVGQKDDNGSVIYIEDYLERSSLYVYAYDNTTQTTIPATYSATSLAGGTVVSPTNAEIQECYDLFLNPEESDAWVLMLGGYNENSVIQKYVIQSIADVRQDIFVLVGPTQASCVGVALESTTLENVIEHRVLTLAVNSSYAAYFGNYKYQEDTYNSTKRWLPLDGDIAGLMISFLENNSERGKFSWGYNNGLIKNIIKLAWNPAKASRDSLWKKEINPVIKDGSSFVILGNKTLLGVNNIFDVVDNRLLFNYLKRGILPSLKYYLGEKNTVEVRRRLYNSLNSFIEPLQGIGDIDEYRIDTSEAVNTPTVLANNELRAICAVKPSSSVRYVLLRLYGISSDISIDEVIVTS